MLRPAPEVVEAARTLDDDRGPGVGTRASTKITSSTIGIYKIATGENQHDARLCATCAESTVWTPELRFVLERRAWALGRRRIIDLPEVA